MRKKKKGRDKILYIESNLINYNYNFCEKKEKLIPKKENLDVKFNIKKIDTKKIRRIQSQ